MANEFDLLAQANTPASPWVPPEIPTPLTNKMSALNDQEKTKQDLVSRATAGKRAAMSPRDFFLNAVAMDTGKGRDTATETELDLQDMTPYQVLDKYGEDEGGLLLSGQGAAVADLVGIETALPRTPVDIWDDFNVNFAGALGATVGNLAGMAVAPISDTAGTTVATSVGDFNEFMKGSQTQYLQSRQELVDAKNVLDSRDAAAQRIRDIGTDGNVVADLKKIGREALSALDNATDDPATFGSGVSSALGSFVAAGPVAKALSAVSKGKLGATTAVALTESAGSYGQTADNIMSRTHEQLMEGSEHYRNLIAEGVSEEDARMDTANTAGMTAAAITAPVAAAAGRLVNRFEGDVTALGSGRQLLGNIGRETTEETIQSGFGQFAQNVATQQIADENQDLTEGVGRQAAEGGLFGMGMTTALGLPSVAAQVGSAGARGVVSLIDSRLSGIREANDKASPVSEEIVTQAAAEAQTTAPVAEQVLREAIAAAPEEQQEAGNAYVDSLLAASTYDPAEAPAIFQEDMADVPNRVGAIQRMAGIVMGLEDDSNAQMRAGYYLNTLIRDYAEVINSDIPALEAIPGDHQAAQIVNQYKDLIGAVTSTPKVVRALESVMAKIEAAEAKVVDVTAESVTTPEGIQDVQDVVAMAEASPAKVDVATAEKILYQVEQGNVILTPRQKTALDSSLVLVRAVQEADKAAVAAGESDPVSLNISSVDGEKGKSLAQHTQGIVSAWNSGDSDLARDRMVDLQNFAQGMNNKVGAYNAHLASGKSAREGLNYEVFVNGEPVTSSAKAAVTPTNAGSVKFVQKVAREAKLLADVYNGLATAFPTLGAKHLAVTSLVDTLTGVPDEVAARNKAAKSPATPAPVAKVTPPQKKEQAPTSETQVSEKASTLSNESADTVAQSDTATSTPTEEVSTQAPAELETKTVEQVPDAVEDTQPVLKGTAALFPNLLGGSANIFTKAFKFPKTQRTRTIGSENPAAFVRDALASSAAFTAVVDKYTGTLTPEIADAYADYLGTVEGFSTELNKNLQSFLDESYSKSNPTTIREVVTGAAEVRTGAGKIYDPVRTERGKPLAIVEDIDGTLAYNPELLEGSILAALQWFMDSDQYGSIQDAKDISNLLGMSEDAVTDLLVNTLNQGMSNTEAKRTLARKISSYWGVQNEANGAIGHQEGIPEGMAAEMLRAFVDGGWLVESEVVLTELDGLPPLANGKPNIKKFIQLIPSHKVKDTKGNLPVDPLETMRPFPSAIELAVLTTPEEIQYIGDAVPLVAQTQLRNPNVPTTPQQREMLAKEQATPYFVDAHIAGVYTAFGRDNVVELFGEGDLEGRTLNKQHAQSLEGVNRSVSAAYDHFHGLLEQINNAGDLETTPVRYQFNVTSVNRMQMHGKYNPQANKFVREALLPTFSTLDLTDQTGQDYKRFMLGVGQMLGIKVHNMSQGTSRAKTETMLNGPLAPAVELLRTFANGFTASAVLAPANTLDLAAATTIKDAFSASGEALTPMAFHAVMDYARYLNAEDKSAFRTSTYVEADGVTNGPINAMMLFTAGMFKGKWVKNVTKGGMFFNQIGKTINMLRSQEGGDARDLYQATTDVFGTKMNYLRKAMVGDAAGTAQMNSMLRLMDQFYGKDLSFVEEEGKSPVLELTRGITKNPLTITIYGSGASGIAAKMTSLLTDAIYERMSQVAELMASGETNIAVAMFGPQSVSVEDAQTKYVRFVESYLNLANKKAVLSKGGKLVFIQNSPNGKKKAVDSSGIAIDPVNFVIDSVALENIRSNVKALFVEPMRQAISETVGPELLDTTELVRMATQSQSIVLEHAFKEEVNTLLAEKAKDPEWHSGDFLTRGELEGIRKKLDHLSPTIDTGNQVFDIAGNDTADIQTAQFGQALNGRFQSPSYVRGPRDAGVSGIPFLNIGSGDGMMMQIMSTMPNAVEGTLKIFDGVNIPLDRIEEGSEQANTAVMETWTTNQLAHVHSTFSKFMSDAKLTGLSEEARKALTVALFGFGEKEVATETLIMSAMLDLETQLDRSQRSIAARQRVLKRVDASVDQMAAVGSPYGQTGDLPLVGTDPDSLAQQLNAYLIEELATVNNEQPSDTMSADIAGLAKVDSTGVSIMTSAELPQLKTVLTAEQQAVVDGVLDSLVADDYKIVFGTAKQINDYQLDRGLSGMSSVPTGEIKGFTNPADKTVYLISPSVETFLHELVHAATFEKISAHYQGVTDKNVSNSVTRLEALMQDFLAQGADLAQTSQSVNSAFNNVSDAINGYLSSNQPAEALNEFMAWTLTNESLVRVAQRQQISKLAGIRKAVVGYIKKLLGIKQEVGTDLFSNLLFNSSIIARTNMQLSEKFAAVSMFMNDSYGSDGRLSDINAALNKSVGRYLDEAPTARQLEQQSVLHKGIQNAYRVGETFMANGFDMTAQESSTFINIVTVLSTEANIDPNSMAAAQQLYSHAMKHLSPTSFMADPDDTTAGVYEASANKFDVLSGKHLVTRDAMGRSSLLPAFIALATVNNEFREVLAKMPVPQMAKNTAGSLDALLENFGNGLMDSLGRRMAGTNKAKNVQEGIDLLNAHMASEINKQQSMIEQVFSKPGGIIDWANDYVVSGLDALSGYALRFAKSTQRAEAGRLEKVAGGIAAGVTALINEDAAKGTSRAVMASINKTKVWDSVHNLINDLVGRTDSNASIYDMIKSVRSVVQRTRQQFREELPILLESKFSRELTKNEKASLHMSMGRTDLAALGKDALAMVADADTAIAAIEAELSKHSHWKLISAKAKQLANYMVNGEVGVGLLRNPEAVARLLGQGVTVGALVDVGQLDRLITLYALKAMPASDLTTLTSLIQDEKDGVQFTLDYLAGQREEEHSKLTDMSRFNYFKGYIPSIRDEAASIVIADDSEYSKLVGMSYKRVADYTGSNHERGKMQSYYHIPVSTRATYEQGIMQNVHSTAGGVSSHTGFTLDQTAGRITDQAMVKKLAAATKTDTGPNPLMPVFSSTGRVMAFERSTDPTIMNRILGEQDIHKTIGQWRGRQVEEGFGQVYNEALIQRMHAMYEKDLAENPDNARQYVDLFSTKDPVWADAVSLMNKETRALVESSFGDKFMVRRDMINDAMGYRAASIGDMWTGNSRWSEGTRKAVRNVAVSVFGNQAYKTMLSAESTIQAVVSDAKTLIVVKSVVVPVSNLMSNVYQLISRGVPLVNTLKSFPAKAAETDRYVKSLVRKIEAEAELRAAHGDVRVERRLKTEIQSIEDSHRRMSIWPLIAAGEFSGIADAGITRGEIPLTSGRLQAYMEAAASKLPGWGSTLGRYAMITKDTALFQGLQKAVEYGDFLAKATYYDDLTQRKGMTQEQALALVTEEFVNYDRLSGRFRGTMENLGLLWFYNFKIRIVKVAASMIRNNPVHAFLAGIAPSPDFFGTVGLPIEDNMITKLLDGTLDYSMGPGQGLNSMMLNPWINLTQ